MATAVQLVQMLVQAGKNGKDFGRRGFQGNAIGGWTNWTARL